MTSHKRLLTAIVTGAMALTGLAAGAGAASAAPAVFNTTSPVSYWDNPGQLVFTVTFKPTGAVTQTITCEPNTSASGGALTNSGSPLQGHIITPSYSPWLRCGDNFGYFYQALFTPQQLNAEKSGTSYSLTSPVSLKINFVGWYGFDMSAAPQATVSVPWINGTGSTVPAAVSRVVFSNTLVGYNTNTPWEVRLTGTFYVSGSGGALPRLS